MIEDKVSVYNHEKRTDDELLAEDSDSICNYAVNGALFYGKHLSKNTSYKKIIATRVSENEKGIEFHLSLSIKDKTIKSYQKLRLYTFSEDNIDEYYIKELLNESTDQEKETKETLECLIAYSIIRFFKRISSVLINFMETSFH